MEILLQVLSWYLIVGLAMLIEMTIYLLRHKQYQKLLKEEWGNKNAWMRHPTFVMYCVFCWPVIFYAWTKEVK